MIPRFLLLFVIAALFLSPLTPSYAQDEPVTGPLGDDPTRSGMDAATFTHFFGAAKQLPSQDATDVRDAIRTFRIWFDKEQAQRGLARAEITAVEQRAQRQFSITFEEKPVLFNDDGRGLDRRRGDGIFTAAVPLRLPRFLTQELAQARPLEEVAKALETFPPFEGRELVKDPRREELLATLRSDNRITQRFKQLFELRAEVGQMEAAAILDRLQIAPEETPLLEAIRRDTVFDLRLLDIPILVFASVLPGDVDPARSLMITDVGVVEDPTRTFDVCSGAGTLGGPWTFAHLMREMAQGSGLSAEDFTLHWLNTWLLPQEANGILVNDPARAAQLQARIITPWLNASGGVPDIERFPARLMSIVSRSDLANVTGYSQAGSGGEARFVFGLLENNGGSCQTLPFTVIFEYGIHVNGCFGLKGWVQQWKALDQLPVGSAAYNTALEAITRQFTDHGTNPGQLPNQNSLAQLRTNENALNPLWELREFTLQGASSSTPGLLDLVTVKQTPDFALNNSATLAAYIASDAPAILAGTHKVPNSFPGLLNPFLGATAPTPFGMFWDAPGVVASLANGVELRHKVSLATCSGCHAGETNTFFTHIGSVGQRSLGTPADLSGFLTGITVTDPVDGSVSRTFGDLAIRQ